MRPRTTPSPLWAVALGLFVWGAWSRSASAGDDSPLESGDVRSVLLPGPVGIRVERFRLDMVPLVDGTEPIENDPVGIVEWISYPEVGGRVIQCEVRFFDVSTRILHTERLLPHERKLVWREMSERSGRTVLVEWDEDGSMKSSETAGGTIDKGELDTSAGALLPLYLVEHVRQGASFSGPFRVFHPLSNRLEPLRIAVDTVEFSGASEESPPFSLRRLELRRPDGLLAGRYLFAGARLVGFQWQEGGPVARPLGVADYEALAHPPEPLSGVVPPAGNSVSAGPNLPVGPGR